MRDFLAFGEPLVGFYPDGGSSLADDVPVVKTWGGDTSNFAIGVSRLGHPCTYLTRVGDDPFGRGFRALWEANGVDSSRVETDPDRRTGLYFVSFDGGRHSLTYYRKDSAASAFGPRGLEGLPLEEYRIVHLTGISLGMSESARAGGLELIRKAQAAGCLVSLDVNYRAAQWASRGAADSALARAVERGVDFLEITDDEAESLGWGVRIGDIRARFPAVPTIVFKRGKAGASVWAGGREFSIPSFEVPVVDTVGAGDSFDAGFLAATLEGAEPPEAARFGAASAALTCTGRGPLERMPRRPEVDAFLAGRPASP
jgi:2-dehydro-3-deoxygluconokinase